MTSFRFRLVPALASAVGVSLIMTVISGCAAPATLHTWRNHVQSYLIEEANSDPNALRNQITQTSRRQFSIHTEKNPDESTDVTGLLLGRRSIAGFDWYLFLVGVIRHRQVEDIRLVLLGDDPRRFRWVVGPENLTALALYRGYRIDQWSILHPERTTPPISATGFPNEGDHFRVAIDGQHVTIVEPRSGAQWSLTLEPTDSDWY